MPESRVTFVIPCFNHGRFIAAAVESCLRQVDADVRVVVVDDGSTDGLTPAACDALASDRVRVIHQPNRGLPGARNRGIAEARELARRDRDWRSDHVAFLDADDYVEPTFVKELADALEQSPPEVSHAYCQERLVELGHGVWKVPDWDPELLLITNLHPVTCLVRWEAFDALAERTGRDGFDETMRDGYEDWELWIAFSELGFRGVRVPRVLFNWRRHSHDTMIFDAVRRHDALYGSIIERHRALYAAHADAIVRRTNSMLRAWNMNWLDESGEPIPLANLKRSRDELIRLRERYHAQGAELAAARKQAEHAERQAHAAVAARDAAQAEAARLRDQLARAGADYERMAAVRLHHALHRTFARLPVPIARLLIGTGGMAARALARLGGRPAPMTPEQRTPAQPVARADAPRSMTEEPRDRQLPLADTPLAPEGEPRSEEVR